MWFPLTRRWLDFGQADVVVEPIARIFTAHLLVPGPMLGGRQLSRFTGRWLVSHGLVLTTISVPA